MYLYVQNNPINYYDPDGAKPKKPGIYEYWRNCSAVEEAECVLECGERGLKSCMFRYLLYVTIRDGKPTYAYKDIGKSCNCKEQEDEGEGFGCKGPDFEPKIPDYCFTHPCFGAF